MDMQYQGFWIRDWRVEDRDTAYTVIQTALAEYGLRPEPEGTDRDARYVEQYYWQTGGEFWVVEREGILVGTGGYYPLQREVGMAEIRKMYLAKSARGQGLGKVLLRQLESAIATQGYTQIWIETASVLKEAVALYESFGYQPATGVETLRCDRVYRKAIAPD